MRSQILIVDSGELNSNPSLYADVWRPEKSLRPSLDQSRLRARSRRNPHRDVPIAMVIVGKHTVHLFVGKEGRLAMGNLLGSAGKSHTKFSHPVQVLLAVYGF